LAAALTTVRRDAVAAACGIAGPAAFVTAWAVGGALADGYDPLRTTISRLAEVGAETAPLMTSGMVAFGVLVPVWARTLGDRLDSPWLRRVVTIAGLGTLVVAAAPVTPDGGALQDTVHYVAAGTSYVAMAATPLVAARALLNRGHRRAAVASVVTGVLSASALAGSVLVGDDGQVGALQRLGLTSVDVWHVVAAATVLRARRG
ncbi:MAG TPA: DUF998 domain-containing protein, partial [Mycobacteriales bacterium]|nr:DUF998 domain-containing protein [Mycobacteriales bacterium]